MTALNIVSPPSVVTSVNTAGYLHSPGAWMLRPLSSFVMDSVVTIELPLLGELVWLDGATRDLALIFGSVGLPVLPNDIGLWSVTLCCGANIKTRSVQYTEPEHTSGRRDGNAL